MGPEITNVEPHSSFIESQAVFTQLKDTKGLLEQTFPNTETARFKFIDGRDGYIFVHDKKSFTFDFLHFKFSIDQDGLKSFATSEINLGIGDVEIGKVGLRTESKYSPRDAISINAKGFMLNLHETEQSKAFRNAGTILIEWFKKSLNATTPDEIPSFPVKISFLSD